MTLPAASYPHIFDAIVSHADTATLCALRQTCHAAKAHADSLLAKQLVLSVDLLSTFPSANNNKPLPATLTPYVRTGDPLPHPQMLAVPWSLDTSRTVILDVAGPIPDELPKPVPTPTILRLRAALGLWPNLTGHAIEARVQTLVLFTYPPGPAIEGASAQGNNHLMRLSWAMAGYSPRPEITVSDSTTRVVVNVAYADGGRQVWPWFFDQVGAGLREVVVLLTPVRTPWFLPPSRGKGAIDELGKKGKPKPKGGKGKAKKGKLNAERQPMPWSGVPYAGLLHTAFELVYAAHRKGRTVQCTVVGGNEEMVQWYFPKGKRTTNTNEEDEHDGVDGVDPEFDGEDEDGLPDLGGLEMTERPSTPARRAKPSHPPRTVGEAVGAYMWKQPRFSNVMPALDEQFSAMSTDEYRARVGEEQYRIETQM